MTADKKLLPKQPPRSHRQGTEPQLHPGSQGTDSLQTLRSRALRAEVRDGKGGLQPLLLVGNT